ncbi:MAG: hypothetical protein JHC52_09655 [Chthoniobacterales bacterium]|nr:hypothetical protein [Chthoniobacterales bacterium]
MKSIFLTALVALLSFSTIHAESLPSNLERRLVGTWMGFPHIMTFKKNGVAVAGLGNGYGRGTWRMEGDMLLVTMPKSGLHQFRILSYDKANNSMSGEYKGRKYPVIKI